MTNDHASPTEPTRLTISISKETDFALRTFLGAQGMKKGDISKFIEEAVRWHIFHQTVRDVRTAFADVPSNELQRLIDNSVEEVRAEHYRQRANRS
jgi:Ribbon-helix-helix domain